MKLPEDKQDECSQTSLYEISRNRLRVIEKLGEGNFGMVSNTPRWGEVDFSRNVIGMCTVILFNKRLSIPCTCVDPLVRNGRDTRVQRHVDVPQKTSDRQIASARLRRAEQVSGEDKKKKKYEKPFIK